MLKKWYVGMVLTICAASVFAQESLQVRAQRAGYDVALMFKENQREFDLYVNDKFIHVLLKSADALLYAAAEFLADAHNVADLDDEVRKKMLQEIHNIQLALIYIPDSCPIPEDSHGVFNRAWQKAFGTPFNEQKDAPCMVNFIIGIRQIISIEDINWYERLETLSADQEFMHAVFVEKLKSWMNIFCQVYMMNIEKKSV
jgi:hypothetical protein